MSHDNLAGVGNTAWWLQAYRGREEQSHVTEGHVGQRWPVAQVEFITLYDDEGSTARYRHRHQRKPGTTPTKPVHDVPRIPRTSRMRLQDQAASHT